MSNQFRSIARLLLLTAIFVPVTSMSAIPDGINYQAYLTDSAGAPINADVTITFEAYTVDVGGVPLWSQTELVSPDNGLFSIQLGNPANPFPVNLFNTPVFVGLFVAGEEMLPRRALRSSAFSFKVTDADALAGFTSSDLDQSTGVAARNAQVDPWQSGLSSDELSATKVRELGTTNRGQERDRVLIHSIASDIGTFTPLATSDVTIRSLSVTDNIDMRPEPVAVRYTLSTASASCHSHGKHPCYHGGVTAVCSSAWQARARWRHERQRIQDVFERQREL